MANRYKEFKQLNLPSIEKEILEKWEREQAFEKSISLREGAEPFVFYEGPPSANGMPGIHHVISRTLKDLVCRYKTAQGFKVERKGGWDTHGLPIELGVEKELGITKEDIGVKISVEEYNQKCREAVLRYKKEWDDITTKMGYWVDLNNPYITFKNEYIETLWWCLKELYKKGLLYKNVSIQPYSPAAGTGLSSHELNQPGTYKMVKDTSATVLFKIAQNEKSNFLFEATNLPSQHSREVAGGEVLVMAWTTTPWTLPSNLGLTVGPNIHYVLVKTFNPYTHEPQNVILAKALINKYFKPEGENGDVNVYAKNETTIKETASESGPGAQMASPTGGGREGAIPWKIVSDFKGKDLENMEYEQLLPYEANSYEAIQTITPEAKPFRILLGDFVTTEDGTGIVHIAPAFGADDFRVGKKYGIGILTLVDREGKFAEGLGEFSGRFIKDYKNEEGYIDVNVDISVKLKKEGRAFKVEKYEHSYPHCWRTDKPVVYYPLDAWFIKTTAVKDRMVELNKTINWKPASTGTGRFGNWLENMVDWNLSRSRYWGTPLPIWICGQTDPDLDYESEGTNREFFDEKRINDPFDKICVGSKEDLINVSSEGSWNCKGFLVDFDKLTIDILEENQDLIDAINNHNQQFHPNSLNYISFESLRATVEKNGFGKKTLINDFRFNLRIIKNYITETNNDTLNNLDFHIPYVDKIVYSRDGSLDNINLYVRVDDVIDVWFDSGAMPYAQWHFPFENKDKFKEAFPANFIAEGVDQTRGWFYTLHALAVMLFDSVAYKNVVSNGLVLDKNGVKMSKRLGNIVDPFATIEQFGADATRWYLITNASPWDNLKFDGEGIKEVQRKFFGTLYNTYQFFALYANVDNFHFGEDYIPVAERPEIDRWVLSSLQTLIKKTTAAFDDYEPTVAGRLIEDFVDSHLSNWYVRLCRRRFWKGEYESDKIAAYQTLYECLETVVRLMAPISPFFSDELFINLNAVTGKFGEASVHHVRFPKAKQELIDTLLEERMQTAQEICSLILSLRKKENIKVRQPLQKALIPVFDLTMQQQLEKVEDLIKSEVNIKQLEYLTDTEGFIKKKLKPNFSALGKKLGSKMKIISGALLQLSQPDIAAFEREGRFSITIGEGETVELLLNEVEIISEDIPGWSVASKGALTVALDINLRPELEQEGIAREFVNKLQKVRKDNGFDVTDRIEVKVAATNGIKASLARFNNYICAEILADKLELLQEIDGGIEVEVNDNLLSVIVLKKG